MAFFFSSGLNPDMQSSLFLREDDLCCPLTSSPASSPLPADSLMHILLSHASCSPAPSPQCGSSVSPSTDTHTAAPDDANPA
ncbi:MAG: hypothetical protein IJ169_04780 [Paludibacteraceae bacterium]|nr:hypothetical protein [Paludibacteraceae bacterium]